MTFPYIGTNGLFTRIGGLGGLLNSVNSFIGTANLSAAGIESVGMAIDKIAGLYATPDLNLIGNLYSARDSYRTVHGSLQSYLQSLAQATLIQMVNEFAPLPALTLANAMTFLVRQMKADGQSVAKPTVSTTFSTPATNIGQGVLVEACISYLGEFFESAQLE